MTRTTKIVIVLIVISVILLGVSFFLRLKNPSDTLTNNSNIDETNSETNSTDTNNSSENTNTNTNTGTSTNTATSDDELTPEALAMLFAERYGSYSTDSDYANILDLTIFMSESFAKNQTAYVEQQRLKNIGIDQPFYGISTQSLSYERSEYSDTLQKIRVTTRRTERKSLQDPEIFYQDIILELIQENDTWKVNAANWQ